MISGEAAVCDHVDRNTEQLFSGKGELGDRQQPDVRRAGDKEIEVALRGVGALPHGTEYAHVAQPVARRELLEFVTMPFERLVRQRAHGRPQPLDHCRRRIPPPGLVRGDIRLCNTAARRELRLTEPSSLTQPAQLFTHITMISPWQNRGKGGNRADPLTHPYDRWQNGRMPELHITDDPAADALLSENPLALLVGMLLYQQVAMETAFAGPLKIKERTGALDAAEIAAYDPEALVEAFRETPAVHRYPGSMAGRTQALCQALVDDWGGDAAALWTQGDPDGPTVLKRLKALPGFGDQKAKIFLALLGKQYGFTGDGWREASAPYGEAGSFRSVADIVSPESLAKVREHKRAAKLAAKK